MNGSYLTGGLVLSPHTTSGSPLETSDWLKIEYVGVPPGRNSRMVVAISAENRMRTLYTEGWPRANREGRKIGLQVLEVAVGKSGWEVWENGAAVFTSNQAFPLDNAHIYLQMSSHSNCPARTVLFDNVKVDTGE